MAGDSLFTSECNRTELGRRYFIRKDLKSLGFETLVLGYKAPDYANLYLSELPHVTYDATHAYFTCVFSGILDVSEGGNGANYERFERTSNNASISTSISFLQTVYRYLYCIRGDADDHSGTRVIVLPATVTAHNTSGTKLAYSGASFFWELFSAPRQRYGLYDEVIETWRLAYIS